MNRTSPRITFDITVSRSFPAFVRRINEDGANIKISSSFEAGSRRNRLGGEGYYVKEHQKLDKEERAAWRNILMAEIEKEKKADEIKIQMVKIEADKEHTLKEMELKAQDQASTSAAASPPPRIRYAKSPKLPSFIDEKDELDSYLLRFECYTKNASWEKNTYAIKLSALLTGEPWTFIPGCQIQMPMTTQVKKSTLNQVQLDRRCLQKEILEVKLKTEETPVQFVIHLKNYLAKWLELSGSSS